VTDPDSVMVTPAPARQEPESDQSLWVTLPDEGVDEVARVHREGETLEEFVDEAVKRAVARRRAGGGESGNLG
jgi:hypothetical protein